MRLEQRSEKVEHLKQVQIFLDLKAIPGALDALAEVMRVQVFQSGEGIIIEGETQSDMFVLVEGRASVYKSTPEGDHYKVAIVQGEQNAFFGEGGLLGSDARSATIKADTLCHCLVLDGRAFKKFCDVHPEWALPVVVRIAHSMMGRLRKANNDLMLLYNALVAEIRGS